MAGILNITAGVAMLLLGTGLTLLVLARFVPWPNESAPLSGGQVAVLLLSAMAVAGVSIFAIVGGSQALRAEDWRLAVAGSLCAVPVGLGIVSLLLVALSRADFQRQRAAQHR